MKFTTTPLLESVIYSSGNGNKEREKLFNIPRLPHIERHFSAEIYFLFIFTNVKGKSLKNQNDFTF